MNGIGMRTIVRARKHRIAWVGSRIFQCRDPNHSPPRRDPSAHTARTKPPAAGDPARAVKAIAETSKEPKMKPVPIAANTTGRSPGSLMAEPLCALGTERLDEAGGSVAR